MLVVTPSKSGESRYATYLMEILRSEGFAGYEALPIAQVSGDVIRGHDIVVLPRCTVSSEVRYILRDYVRSGGTLLAIQPDVALAATFGFDSTHRALRRGYLRASATHPGVSGLPIDTIQVPVSIVDWRVESDDVLAWASDTREGTFETPGLSLKLVDQGKVAVFSFDLAHAVAMLRQGDPSLAEITSSGLDGVYRPSEMFTGWLDADCTHIPQADVLSALLARAIEELSPQPRIWYYPSSSQNSAQVMTSDDDWSTPEQFDQLVGAIESRGGRGTFFLVPHSRLDRERIARWVEHGHSFSVHPALESDLVSYRDTAEPQPLFMERMLVENVARHRAEHGFPVTTIRHHCARWLGFVDAARVLERLGVGMDLNYVSVFPFSAGFMAGSGRPLRFVDESGEVIDVFQQPTLWTEEALIHPDFVFSLKWTNDDAIEFCNGLLDSCVGTHYSPYAINSHPVSFATYSRPLIEAVLDRAVTLNVPIVNADEWHTFTRRRDAVRIPRSTRTLRGFSIDLHVPHQMERLSLILPATDVDPTPVVVPSSSPSEPTVETHTVRRWGRDYLGVDLSGEIVGNLHLWFTTNSER